MNPALLVILLLNSIQAVDQLYLSNSIMPGRCNPGLLASYDLDVVRRPINNTNFICEGIQNNCCTAHSQLIIFKNWIQGNEKAKLLHVYKTFIATYSLLFDDFKLVEQMAEIVLTQKPADQTTNCGEMATSIQNLKASQLKDQALSLAKRAYRFIYDSRRGFYCSLCDADAHLNYNTLDGSIHMSYGYCSALVKETMGWNAFRFEYFGKIARLYGHFMSTCATNGKYSVTHVLKYDLKFFDNHHILKHIHTCTKNINDNAAIGLCYGYCNHFNPAKFSRMFEGQFEKLLAFRIWLNKQVVLKIFASLVNFSKDDLSFNGRILQGTSSVTQAAGTGTAGAANVTAANNSTNNKTKKAEKPHISAIDQFNKRYGAQAVEPVTYRSSQDFHATKLFDYTSSIFRLGKDKIYSIANFRRIISTSGMNFLKYGYMLDMNNQTLAALNVQLNIESDAKYKNVTYVFSENYQYRNSSIQKIH